MGGRKLIVGDCALFQAGNAPPFIGILRKLTQEKDTTKFAVNWLYRPADVKLAKGGPLEAAPNEIFYSFHKDEISAASLLHPCKVAFLRKGIELPPGVSSFVCRRVYDTANKCLWWLTDRDYTDEHQDEVDLLLERTKLEMQVAVQSGGPSPRAAVGPTSSQQLKSSSEVVQNATYSAPIKSKKRERADQSLEPSKRERSVKSEDGEVSPLKRERNMKPEEIASITDKDGGLLNPAGVERLVQLMQQDRNDGVRKSADVASRRTLLVGVVAATERDDCLSRFVQLGGLPMLDDWLQEAHKGKVGDAGSPKEGDKGVEELLLTLLKALDKLPVDLDALKTCSVGKSVNHLRSHKNQEIQKKARKLVDIWKKRVDAEMKLSGEVKSGTNHGIWSSSYKQNSPDMLHSHLMKTGGPTEVAVKSSGAFAGSAKAMPNGTSPADSISKAASVSAGKMSPVLVSATPSTIKRDENSNSKLTNSTSVELPVKEEKSSSTVQSSQSNGQAWGSATQGKSAAEESMRAEPERNVKELNEQNGVGNGVAQRNGPSEGAMGPEDGKKAEMGAGAVAAADGAGSDATAMEVDDLGITLLAGVAASEIRTGASETAPERTQQEESSVQGCPSRMSSDGTTLHLKDAPSIHQGLKEGGNGKEHMESKAAQDVLGSNPMKGRKEVGAEQGGEGKPGKPGDSDSKKEGLQERESPSGEGDTKDFERGRFAAQEGSRVSETSGGSGAGKSSLDRKGEDRHVNETQTESAALTTGSGHAFSKDMKSAVGGIAENSVVSPDGHNASKASKKESLDERKIQVQGNGIELCNGYSSPASELKISQAVKNSPVGDVASERLDRGIGVRSTGPRDSETDLPRSVGGTGDNRKGPVSVSEAMEAAADGVQELTRRAMDMRTLGRVPSFPPNQMLGLPNLSSTLAAVSSQHVNPAPRTLPAGEPTTPEQGTETAGPSDGVVGGSDVSERPDFDLNEGFSVEESPHDESTSSPVAPAPVFAASLPAPSSLLAAPIAIVTATKGGFVLPASPLRTKSELGWKGSAATSAFRPAEPRRTPDRQPSAGDILAPEASVGSTAKKVRPPLDLNIDLNVVDDRSFEEVGIATTPTASSMPSKGSAAGMSAQVSVPRVSISGVAFRSDCAGSGQPPHRLGNSAARPFLDLNMLDESEESGTLVEADMRVPRTMAPSAGSNKGSSLQATQHVNVVRDFDLNDGPLVEDVVPADQPVLQPLPACNTGASMISMGPGLRRGPEVVNASWFTASNSFKAAIPEFSSSRAESPYSVAAAAAAQSYLSAGAGGAPFNSDLYRGSVALPSAPPKASFPSGTQAPYAYGGFPVPSGFPFTTGATFTPSNVAPYLDSSGSVNFPIASSGTGTSHLGRPPPYLMGLSEVGPPDSNHSGRSARPSLDLNAGPEPVDGDGLREDLVSTRPSAVLGGPPSLDQMRVFRQVVHAAGPGGVPPLKRKEPENAWEMNRSSGFKQQAWR